MSHATNGHGPTVTSDVLDGLVAPSLGSSRHPQVAGRSERAARLGLVEGVGFPPELAPWAHLRSVMRSQDHLSSATSSRHL